MNILVINLSLRPDSKVKIFPIGLGYITTAMKKAGYVFDILDIDAHRYSESEIEKLIQKRKYDVVCMGCIVTGYKYVKDLSILIKRYHPHSIIIVGNSVATSIVNTLLLKTDSDIAVIGEGDETIIELLNAISNSISLSEVKGISYKKNGKIVNNQQRPVINNISKLPHIDFSIFDIEIYIESSKNGVHASFPIKRETIRALPINTARGCVANCNFCYHVFKGKKYRFRSPDSIMGEIKEMINKYSLNYIQFWDELTFFSKKQADAFVQKILDENLHFYWVADCRSNLFTSEEDIPLIHKMKQAGCCALGYSLESASPEILKAMNKKTTVEQFSRQTQILHKAGLKVLTSLVLGYPQETPETIRATFDCCIQNNIYPSSGYLLPQPGSEIYDYARQHGFINDEEEYLLKMGDRQDLRLNLTQIPNEEFEAIIKQELKRCNEILGMGLKESELIKTQFFRTKKEIK
jgi:anaerobic magnesium-protoporphyrin IX monomethyl ester cyclase